MAMSGAGPAGIFISYRRADASWPTRWLTDQLAGHFGAGMVFQDVDSIQPGDDFAAEIEAAVGACSVLLVLIGPRWLAAEGDAGRRLDDPGDWVRLELEVALTRGVRIIPVLIDGATMPAADELPTTLRELTRRQAVALSPVTLDTRRLISVLETVLVRDDKTPGQTDGVKPSPAPGKWLETDPAAPDDQALADEIAAKNPYDAADAIAVLPGSQAAHILTLMDPKTAPLVLAKLSDAAAREILPSLEPDTLVAMLDPFDNSARLLKLADARLAAATLSKMQESGGLSGGMVLRRMEPQSAAAIIDEMTRGELDKAHYFSTGAPPDPLDRLIDYVSIERSLYLMNRISFGRAAKLLENMVKRDSKRAEILGREMKRELAGGILGEMDFDTARGWITRMDAASVARLLEAMPSEKAAIMRKSIEKPYED